MKLSIIIPVYNQEKLLLRAVQSIPKNDDIEIIIINDGSIDNTAKTITELCKEERVKGLKLATNQGVANARNLGLDFAKGEYIMMLDSDDYIYEQAFNKVLMNLDGTDLVYYNLKVNSGFVIRLVQENKKHYCGNTKFMRREFIGKTRYPKGVRFQEDYFFYEKLLEKEPTEKFTNLVVAHYDWPREGSLCNIRGKSK